MDQIKFDLKAISMDAADHPIYVVFIRDIVSLIRSHCTGMCTIDEFFYQINKEYSPSLQDPQLHVAGIISYGLRLGEGDARVVPQLFYYLYNNFKVALINNKLGNEARMLRKGMKNNQILGFVFSKMLPAVATAAVRVRGAFTVLDVYCEGMAQLFARYPASHELPKEMLPDAIHLLRTVVRCLYELSRGGESLISAEKLHVACRLCSIANVLWPSLGTLSYTDTPSPSLDELKILYRRLHGWLDGSISYLEDVLILRETSPRATDLFGGLRAVAESLPPADSSAVSFVESIVTDVQRNWIITEENITIQAPGRVPGSTSTQSGQGTRKPLWDVFELTESLKNELEFWNMMQERTFPLGDECRKQDRGTGGLFF